MKDLLLDLVSVVGTQKIGVIKVSHTNDGAKFETIHNDNRFVLKATALKEISQIKSTFGITDINKLKGALSAISRFDDTELTITERTDGTPFEIEFIANNKKVKHNVRLTAESTIQKQPTFRGAEFDVIIYQPSVDAIKDLSSCSYLGQKCFTAKIEKNILYFEVGDKSTDRAIIPFAENITGKINELNFPIDEFLQILKCADLSKTNIKISGEGLMEINFDTDYIKWQFLFPSIR